MVRNQQSWVKEEMAMKIRYKLEINGNENMTCQMLN